MEKRVIIVLFLAILILAPIISAQTYSGVNRFTDNVKMFFASGDDEVRLALEIREKEIDSAINNVKNQGEDKVIKNLERASKKLQIVQEKVSLNTSEEIKTSVDEVTDKINSEDNLPDEFEDYLLEEEKTQLTAELTEKTFEYCSELAKEDFALMLKEEECNPETAIPGLEKELEKLKDLQLRMFVQLMLEIRSCIDDPGTCNCEANVDVEQKEKCEKMVALAIKCEYKEDETSCNELESMRPKQGDNFAESFIPDFLINLFREKSYMIEYNVEHSDGVPEECWDDNDKPECKQYAHLKETKDDWDEYGNFIGKKPKNKEPTMRESIPQCFDENDNFLEEKCGEITMVKNEDGLINYIIENEINGILGKFTNNSEQTYAPGTTANGSAGYAPGTTVNGSDGQMQVQNKAWEIKQEINQINNQIKNITYAPGTGPGGKGGVVVDGDDDGSNGGYAPGTSGDSPGNTIVNDDGDNDYAPGTSGDSPGNDVIDGGGDVVGGGDNTIDPGTVDVDDDGDSGGDDNDVDGGVDPGPQGIVGNQGDDSSDDDTGGDSAPITGEIISNSDSNNFLKKIFNWLF